MVCILCLHSVCGGPATISYSALKELSYSLIRDTPNKGRIKADKKSYYHALEQAQKSNDITPRIQYFIHITLAAQKQANGLVDFMLKKSKFFNRFKGKLNERQLKVVRKMFDAGLEGFEGGMRAKKYMSLTKASKATATRDLQHLLEIGVLISEGGGRSTRYALNI